MFNALMLGLMACVPRYSDLPAIEPDDLWAPLPIRSVEVQGVEVAYVDSGGPGQPLLFVHGLSSYIGFWEHQIPHYVEAGYRVIALDLPGFGASERPDAPMTPRWYAGISVGLMGALDVPSAIVVGHSMGGQTAMWMALEHAPRVEALVLSAPAGFETFEAGAKDWMKAWWTESRALHSSESEVRAAFTQAVFNNPDEGVERLLRERVQLGRSDAFRGTSVAVSRSIAGMLDEPVYDRLGEIRAPTLIVYGTEDRMIPNPVFTGGRTRAVGERGRDAIPGAELVMIPRAGHTVHHDDPGAFNAAVDRFLEAL